MKTEKYDITAEFLLGKLTGEEQEKIEQKYFFDKKFFEEILFVENELIDAYVSGNLSAEDQVRFENRLLLNPKQRQRVEFSKILHKYVSSQTLTDDNPDDFPSSVAWFANFRRFFTNKPLLSFSFAAAFIMIFFGGMWLMSDKSNSGSGELAVSQVPQQKKVEDVPIVTDNQNQIVGDKPQTAPSPPVSNGQKTPRTDRRKTPQNNHEESQNKKSPIIFSFVLSPGLTRSAGSVQRLTIPPKTDFVKMSLKLEAGDYSSYQAVLETVEGNFVWRNNNFKTKNGNKTADILIPVKLLKSADYILSIKGRTEEGTYESAADYSFSVDLK